MEKQAQPAVEFRDVSYQPQNGPIILQGLSLSVNRGEILVLLGRSGSGKTTSLKLVNRLLEPTAGELAVEGRPVRQWDTIQLRRHLGYAIQEIGLFPHYTIERNIGLVPEIERRPKDQICKRIQELMALVGLESDIASRYPHQLSGGQRQRVGVARALAADPPILLMDEPFGAVDPLTRAGLQREFLALQKRLQKTVLFVTHDLREALFLGTRIALLEGGRLVALHTPQEFLRSSEPLVQQYVSAFDNAPQLQSGGDL